MAELGPGLLLDGSMLKSEIEGRPYGTPDNKFFLIFEDAFKFSFNDLLAMSVPKDHGLLVIVASVVVFFFFYDQIAEQTRVFMAKDVGAYRLKLLTCLDDMVSKILAVGKSYPTLRISASPLSSSFLSKANLT